MPTRREADLERRVLALEELLVERERRIERLQSTRRALMDRMQRIESSDLESHVLFEHASLLQRRAAQRTAELERTTADLTYQRERLEIHGHMLEQTARLARVGGWQIESKTCFPDWSDEAFLVHGLTPRPLFRIEEAFATYDEVAREQLISAVHSAIQEGTPWDLELPHVDPSGHARWIRAIGERVLDADGDPRVIGAFQDITGQKQAQLELARASEEAEAANESKSRFLAVVSHEIRTPITAIIGFAELLEEGELDAELAADYVSTIRRNGQALLALLNDILDVSKMEAGRYHVETTAFDPIEVLKDAVRLIRGRAEPLGVPLDVIIADNLPQSMNSDPLRWRQVLLNVLGNAVKFSASKQPVEIRAQRDDSEQASHLVIEVEDRGIGMSPDQVSSLFRAFYQADATVSRRFGGTGLGLRISKTLIELLGGTIGVRSELGRGTVVRLELPIVDEAESLTEAAVESTRARDLHGIRVLVVEDGRDNQRLIRAILQRANATVESAWHGQECLERLDEPALPLIDLVLMDMAMPVLDGYSAARMARERGHSVPIIALTAHTMPGEAERCAAAGCDAFEAKPIDRGSLLQTCLSCLSIEQPGGRRIVGPTVGPAPTRD